jgi:hypothetical protein
LKLFKFKNYSALKIVQIQKLFKSKKVQTLKVQIIQIWFFYVQTLKMFKLLKYSNLKKKNLLERTKPAIPESKGKKHLFSLLTHFNSFV